MDSDEQNSWEKKSERELEQTLQPTPAAPVIAERDVTPSSDGSTVCMQRWQKLRSQPVRGPGHARSHQWPALSLIPWCNQCWQQWKEAHHPCNYTVHPQRPTDRPTPPTRLRCRDRDDWIWECVQQTQHMQESSPGTPPELKDIGSTTDQHHWWILHLKKKRCEMKGYCNCKRSVKHVEAAGARV